MMRFGILGGTFNPIHIGHLVMAENALDQLGLDQVIFAPAGDPPHKPADGIINAAERLRLILLAITDRPGFVGSDIDLAVEGPSYTWHLLERCRDVWPEATFHFIVGGDSLRDFASWSRPGRILELARIAVIQRPGATLEHTDLDAVPGLRDRLDVIDAPMCDVSATDIRERVLAGRTIRYVVPEAVRLAIVERGHYRLT